MSWHPQRILSSLVLAGLPAMAIPSFPDCTLAPTGGAATARVYDVQGDCSIRVLSAGDAPWLVAEVVQGDMHRERWTFPHGDERRKEIRELPTAKEKLAHASGYWLAILERDTGALSHHYPVSEFVAALEAFFVAPWEKTFFSWGKMFASSGELVAVFQGHNDPSRTQLVAVRFQLEDDIRIEEIINLNADSLPQPRSSLWAVYPLDDGGLVVAYSVWDTPDVFAGPSSWELLVFDAEGGHRLTLTSLVSPYAQDPGEVWFVLEDGNVSNINCSEGPVAVLDAEFPKFGCEAMAEGYASDIFSHAIPDFAVQGGRAIRMRICTKKQPDDATAQNPSDRDFGEFTIGVCIGVISLEDAEYNEFWHSVPRLESMRLQLHDFSPDRGHLSLIAVKERDPPPTPADIAQMVVEDVERHLSQSPEDSTPAPSQAQNLELRLWSVDIEGGVLERHEGKWPGGRYPILFRYPTPQD